MQLCTIISYTIEISAGNYDENSLPNETLDETCVLLSHQKVDKSISIDYRPDPTPSAHIQASQ